MSAETGLPQSSQSVSPQPPRAPGKSLGFLLDGLATVGARQERAIGGLSLDSRRVNAHDLFIAVPGETGDGRDYIRQAVQGGAVAVAREKDSGGRSAQPAQSAQIAQTKQPARHGHDVPSFAIADLKQHIGAIAARFYDHPSARMRLIGITGTNGKTTCAYLLAQALTMLGQRCALLSTVGAGFVGALEPSALTTADAIHTQRTLAALLERGAEAVCVEVSSHGLAQGRVNQVAFDVALLTNLSRDHLDYHGGMAHYARAKRRLFEFDGLTCAVLNVDDPFGRRLLRSHRADRCLGYGLHGDGDDGDLRPRDLELNENGIAFEVACGGQRARIRSTLIGAVNVPNLLAVIATLVCCGYDLGQIAGVAGRWRAPPGRMELLRKHPSQPAVVVDYAHTPDALARALASLRELCRGRLWVVFGCGGDRDRGKRAPMGGVAESGADRVIVTDDNPRTEAPGQITGQIVGGMKAGATVIHDRRRAIETAIAGADADDIVLVAGKGHETTQRVGGRVIELSDRAIAGSALAALAVEPAPASKPNPNPNPNPEGRS